MSPVNCGQMSIMLWLSGSGAAIAPVACSTVIGPSVRTDGVRSVAVDSVNKKFGDRRDIFKMKF